MEACDATGHLALVAGLAHGSAAETGAVPPGEAPIITATHDGRSDRRVVDAVAAQWARIRRDGGGTGAGAGAGPDGAGGTAGGRYRGVEPLAGWCLRYAPLAAAAPPDGVWIDVTGSAHLQGGETRLLRDLVCRLLGPGLRRARRRGRTPRARHMPWRGSAGGRHGRALRRAGGRTWPGCLWRRCACRTRRWTGCGRMGIEQIGALAALPRARLWSAALAPR